MHFICKKYLRPYVVFDAIWKLSTSKNKVFWAKPVNDSHRSQKQPITNNQIFAESK